MKPKESLYWQDKSYQERLAALEEIRGEYNLCAIMLSKDFKEFIALLNKHDVKYLVIGGYAVA